MSLHSPFDYQGFQNCFIKFAQHLAGLTDHDDVWCQLGHAISHFFNADLVGFLHRGENGHWKAHYWSFPPGCTEEDVFTPALQQTAAEVLKSSFMAGQSVELKGACQIALFPLTLDSQRMELMIVGHIAEQALPKDLLNIYLGVADLAGETVTRLGFLARLRKHSDSLQQLIDGSSGDLAAVNNNLSQAHSLLTREVSQRQRIEQALRDAEREKSAILNGLQEVEVFLLNPEMRIIWTNAGRSLPDNRQDEDLRGRYCYKAFQGRDVPCSGCTALAALTSGRFREGEITLPDGRSMITRSNPLKNEKGEISGVVHVSLDITRRKMVEQALMQRETQLRSIVENALEIIYTLTPEGMISYASPRWTQLIGHETLELLGAASSPFYIPPIARCFNPSSTPLPPATAKNNASNSVSKTETVCGAGTAPPWRP